MLFAYHEKVIVPCGMSQIKKLMLRFGTSCIQLKVISDITFADQVPKIGSYGPILSIKLCLLVIL